MRTSAIFASTALCLLGASPALAQSKFTKLDEEPAIRNKIEYRDGRFEIVPTGIASVASGLRQHFHGGLRVRYHFSDFFALGLSGFGGVSLPTGTFNDILSARGLANGEADLDASNVALDDLRRVREVKAGAALDAEFTPIYGKISIAGRFFARYDISAVAGVSALQTSDIVAPQATGEAEVRVRPAPHLGLGTRIFFSEAVALNIEVRDTIVIDNFDGGINAAGEPVNEVNHFLTFGLGASVFFPGKAKIGR